MRRVEIDGWAFAVPDDLSGGQVQHSHAHLSTMAIYRGQDVADLEVIATTYPGRAVDERGQALDTDGLTWDVAGAARAIRRDQLTHLDEDTDAAPVNTVVVVATAPTGSVCLVVHRPLDAPAGPSEAIARSLELTEL